MWKDLLNRHRVCIYLSHLGSLPKGNFIREELENQAYDRPASVPSHPWPWPRGS